MIVFEGRRPSNRHLTNKFQLNMRAEGPHIENCFLTCCILLFVTFEVLDVQRWL